MNLSCGRTLALILAAAARDAYGTAGPDVLVPVPLAAGRIARRGHNQAVFLARHVGRILDRPVLIRGARRVRAVGPQRGLGRTARLTNVSGAFLASARVAGRSVGIIDDVITTGSTATAMAEALQAAGAAEIHLLAVARTLRSR
jgi:ComF family protein